MKTNKLLRLACLVIGLVMLVSAMPISAAYTPFATGNVKAPAAASEGHIDFVLRDFGTVGQKPNLSKYATSAVNLVPFENNTNDIRALVKEESNGNQVYSSNKNKTDLVIKDLIGESRLNGFVYSADYYFGNDYITGIADTDVKTCIQFLRIEDSGTPVIARLGHDGTIYATLETGSPAIPGVKISANQWFNFRVEFTGGTSNYTYYIYIDDVLIYNETWSKTPEKKAINYRVLASDKDVGYSCMIDNIEFRTLPIVPDTNRVDTTIDFENLLAADFTASTWVDAENLGSYLNTSKTAVSTSKVGSLTMNSAIATNSNATYNRVWKNASSRAFFVVEDLEKRLVDRDFTVSADMMFSELPVGKVSLIQWLRGTSTTSDTATNEFLNIDSSGRFYQNGIELGAKVEKNQWFNVTVRVSYVSHGVYNVAIYIDEELVSVSNMNIACSDYANGKSYIKFFSTAGVSGVDRFTVQLDNVQIYESDNGKIYEEKDVIWDLDFNDIADGTKLDTGVIMNCSEGYDVIRSIMGDNAVVDNGRLKITAALNKWIDLKLGGGSYDPVKEGPVAISFKFNLESKDTVAKAKHRLVGLRRTTGALDNGSGKTTDVLYVKDNKLIFFGRTVLDEIELNKDYDIKVILDGQKHLASLYIDNEKYFDNLHVIIELANSSTNIIGENLTFVTDDAGNKYLLPHTGFVYQQKYDATGAAIAGSYVRRFVQNSGYSVDLLRLFQTGDATPNGMVYYVDDFRVECAGDEKTVFSTDFTGWSSITDKKPGNTNSSTNSYIQFDGSPVIADDGNGNEYLSCTGEQRMFFSDKTQETLFQTVELSLDMYYTKLASPGGTGATGIINLNNSTIVSDDPYGYKGYGKLLQADENGNLYSIGGTLIASGVNGKWTKIKIVLNGNGKKWTQFDYYINGQLIVSDAVNYSGWKDYNFRFIPNKRCSFYLDNIYYGFAETGVENLALDFDGDYETVIESMDGGYKFPAIDSTRTDANGGTVVSAQVLGEDDKFLRIDRTLLAADQLGYIAVENSKCVGQNQYIVETDFRFTSESGHGITPLTITTDNAKNKFTPLEVRGAENTITASIRGAHYTLTDASGNPIKVNKITDDGFTKLAVLVNEDALTYTVYVNGNTAYYYYDGEYLPTVNLPITYVETGIRAAIGAQLKILEVPSQLHNYSIIDIDRIAIISAPSTLASEFKATQSRVNISSQTFDLRFIAGLDSLYGSKVGFEVVATYVDGTEKTVEKTFSTNTVFSSIDNNGETVLASAFESNYLSVLSITALPITNNGIRFVVTPFVEYGDVRCLGKTESFVATCNGDTVVVK